MTRLASKYPKFFKVKKELDEQNVAIQQKQKQLSAKKKELSEKLCMEKRRTGKGGGRMRMIRPEQLKHLRETYPAGTRVELIQMDDVQAPPTGTCGTVTGVDDTGSLMVNWDNGSGLNVIYGVDVVRKVVKADD